MSPRRIIGCLLWLAAAPAWAAPTGSIAGVVTADGESGPRVVYIERATVPPKEPPAPARAEQRDTQFSPRTLVVVQNQTVAFPNNDKFYHNVFSPTPGSEFDLGLYRGGASKTVQLHEPGEVDVYCNIHPNMELKILVLQNELYAQAAADGSYRIADVPPGSYTLVAWSPTHEPVKRTIQVNAGATVKADFALKQKREAKSHLNKNGEQYGRYH